MERHQYGNTETFHLWNAWEEVSGKPIAAVMGGWTEQMGFPLLVRRAFSEALAGRAGLVERLRLVLSTTTLTHHFSLVSGGDVAQGDW